MCVAVSLVVILLLLMFGSADMQLPDGGKGFVCGNKTVIISYWFRYL